MCSRTIFTALDPTTGIPLGNCHDFEYVRYTIHFDTLVDPSYRPVQLAWPRILKVLSPFACVSEYVKVVFYLEW